MEPRETCGQFEKLLDLAKIASPELVAQAALVMPDIQCGELCGGVREECLRELAHPHARPSETPDDDLLKMAAGSIDTFFHAALNPEIIKWKRAMALLAIQFNAYLAQGRPVPPEKIKEYKETEALHFREIDSMFKSVNFMKMKGGNFIVNGLFQMMAHKFNNKVSACISASALELEEISEGKIPEDRTFKDHYANLSLLHVGPDELRPFPESASASTLHALETFKRDELSEFPVPIRLVGQLPKGSDPDAYAYRAIIHPRIFEETITELLRNGAYAMPPEGGSLTVSVQRIDGYVVINVSDTGKGIPLENMDKIFRSSFTTRDGGTGLGLALAKEYIEKTLGGKLLVASEVGKGSTFSIWLPGIKD